MKFSKAGSELRDLDELAPGVRGYAIWDEATSTAYVPMIESVKEGSGDVVRPAWNDKAPLFAQKRQV